MLILATTTDKLQLIASAIGSLDVHVSFASRTESTGAVTNANTNTVITTAATIDILASPGAGVVRNGKFVSVRNKSATVANTITLQHTNGTTVVEIVKATLLVGEEMVVTDAGAIFFFDSSGAVKSALVTPLTRTILSGSGTYTVPAGCRAIDVECIGGGGAGGGSSTVAASGGGGGGGGAGGRTRKLFSPPAATYVYAVGAGGTAGAAGATAGNNGADTTFGTLTAKGATGGSGAAAAATTIARGGSGGVAGSGGDTNDSGEVGEPGFNTTAALVISGGGGGKGANGVIVAGAGTAAVAGTGGGGSGGASVSASAAVAGGVGGSGTIIITEFY